MLSMRKLLDTARLSQAQPDLAQQVTFKDEASRKKKVTKFIKSGVVSHQPALAGPCPHLCEPLRSNPAAHPISRLCFQGCFARPHDNMHT